MKNLLFPAVIALMSSSVFAQTATNENVEAEAASADTAMTAGECKVEIEGNDQMKFNIDHFTIDTQACKDFTVVLHHTGKLGEQVMGHNVVITKAADMNAVAQDGIKAKDNNYVKPEDDRVVAHTDVIGGGESTEVTFSTDKLTAGEAYEFFCSFPGHYAIMKGDVEVK